MAITPMIRKEADLVAGWITHGRRSGAFRRGGMVTGRSLLTFQQDQNKRGWSYRAMVVRDGASPIGYFDMRHKGVHAEILGIFVDSAFQGQRIGRYLLRYAIAMLREKGCTEVTMEVFTKNLPSLRMAASAGFKPVRRFKHPADADMIVVLHRPISTWPRMSKTMPRYALLRGENLYFHHAAVAEALLDVFTHLPGVEIVLGLGSLARGFGDEWSDLDLAILGRGLSLKTFWQGELWLAGLSVDLFVVDLDSSTPGSWELGRRQAYEESRILFSRPEYPLNALKQSLRLGSAERRWGIYDLIFRMGWLGFAPRNWYMKVRHGYLWSLPPDEWLHRGCVASAHITVDRVVDMLFQLLFLLNWQHVPDAKWRRFLIPGLQVVPTKMLSTLQDIETLPRDVEHLKERADLLLSLVDATAGILSRQGHLKGNLYRAFLKHCPDYDPKS